MPCGPATVNSTVARLLHELRVLHSELHGETCQFLARSGSEDRGSETHASPRLAPRLRHRGVMSSESRVRFGMFSIDHVERRNREGEERRWAGAKGPDWLKE